MSFWDSYPKDLREETDAVGIERKGHLQTRIGVWGIVFAYAVVAGLWIFFSDRLMSAFIPPEKILEWSILKGLCFVAVTATMLFVLISGLASRLWRASSSWAASERKFRTLFEEVTDGILVAELETKRIFLVNAALSQMLGYSREELRKLTVLNLHPADTLPYVTDAYANLKHRPATIISDALVSRKNGTVFYVDINATTLKIENTDYIIGVFRDISEHKRVESDLKAAKESAETANHAKDQFIAVLSHELRTPLTPALATIATLEGQADITPGVQADLEVVRRNLELESKLIDDLLDVTRISRGKIDLHLEETDIHDSVRRALEICRRELELKQIAVSVALEAKHFHVLGDAARLQQVFWNLLKNAVKFTPDKGVIWIRSMDCGACLRVEVADTGVGIDPEVLPRIFIPFEQGEQTANRRFGGLGLGLSIARDLVTLHQGTLTASSEGKNKGAVFVVELPVMEKASPLHPQPTTDMVRHQRILLVDDHADTLRILGRLLRKWHYEVESAHSVQSALEMAAQKKFDMLISDVGLPDGSGRDVMRQVKALYGLRGIALSGYSAESDFVASREAGFEEHLVKPIKVSALQSALHRILEKPEAQS